jgi:V/A-type H+-transporting ATPase subunit E
MSDKNLGQLIEALKTEAIDAAEKEAKRIVTEANLQAQKTLKAAEEKRDTMIQEAEAEAKAILSKGESALRQAGRDYSISVRNEMLQMFELVLEKEIEKEFTPEVLKSAIIQVVENIGSDVELKLSKDFSAELAAYIHSQLKSSKNTVSIMEDSTLLNRFSISHDDQGWSYSISPEEVSEALKHHLNHNWKSILTKAT